MPDGFYADNNAAFRRKRDYVLQRLRAIPDVRCPTPQGAFYVFPTISAFFGRRRPGGGAALGDSEAICLYLLEQARVARAPPLHSAP